MYGRLPSDSLNLWKWAPQFEKTNYFSRVWNRNPLDIFLEAVRLTNDRNDGMCQRHTWGDDGLEVYVHSFLSLDAHSVRHSSKCRMSTTQFRTYFTPIYFSSDFHAFSSRYWGRLKWSVFFFFKFFEPWPRLENNNSLAALNCVLYLPTYLQLSIIAEPGTCSIQVWL